MMSTTSLALLASLLLPAAPRDAGDAAPATHEVKRSPFKSAIERDGVFLAADYAEITFWPEAYRDELRVVEVVPPGRAVRTGDVILRIETRNIDRAVRQGEIELLAAEQRLKDAKADLDSLETDLQAELTRATMDAQHSEKRLKNYLEIEKPFADEDYAMGEQSFRNSLSDAEEELRQLGKMYTEDELTEETEEIVLKRSKRDYESSKKRFDLMLRRRAYSVEQQQPMQLEAMTLEAREKGRALDRVKRTQDSRRLMKRLDWERAALEVDRQTDALARLKRDRELFTIRSPRDGILLHGKADSAEERKLTKGGGVPMNETLFTVASPGKLRARFTVPESDSLRLRGGLAASVKPASMPDRSIAAKVEPLDLFPASRQGENLWNGTASFTETDERLVPGMKAKVEVVIEEIPDAIAVPSGAVFKKGDAKVCWVKGADGTPVSRPVKTGSTSGGSTVIVEGLAPGETILLTEPAPAAGVPK